MGVYGTGHLGVNLLCEGGHHGEFQETMGNLEHGY